MTKHTPGPLTTKVTTSQQFDQRGDTAIISNGQIIGEAFARSNAEHEHPAEANAALWAAAPDLADALEKLRDDRGCIGTAPGYETCSVVWEGDVRSMKHAGHLRSGKGRAAQGGAAVSRRVYVYRHDYEHEQCGSRHAYSLAYFTEQTRGACVHEIEADGLTRSKIQNAAIREHREKCGNRVTP